MDPQKLLLQSFLLLLHFTLSFSTDTIAINQTIQDCKDELLVSRGKNFALGFFSPGSSKHRYLGIWYYKVPLKTVVWVANRNHPINDSSGVLSIDQYGNLILYSNHTQTVPVWSSNVSVKVAETRVAQLFDSGNLILFQDKSKRIVWQSFDHPTDTILPGMKYGFNRKTGVFRSLTSWRSPEDPGTGNFLLQINPEGIPQCTVYKGKDYYWRSILWPKQIYADVWNYSLVNNQDEIYLTHTIADSSVILRAVLDYSGTVKKLAWNEKFGVWKEFWAAPTSQCDAYGHCGAYGKCDPDVTRSFECDCLPGYEPKSPRDWHILRDASGGCVRKRLESSSVCQNGEGFLKVAHAELPDTSAAVLGSTDTSPMDCEHECRRNCLCSAYASRHIDGFGNSCLTWYGKLIDTVENVKEGYDFYVRVDAVELANTAQKSKGSQERKDMLAALIVSIVSAWFVLILFAYLWLKKKRKLVRKKWHEKLFGAYDKEANEVGDRISHPEIAIFNLSTILAATNNFSLANKLGDGGFGLVYQGQLSNGKKVAVKRLSKNSGQGIEEFKNEVMLIAKLQHKNLVKLIGCCVQGEELMLVYEHLPNKSLDSFLFDETKRTILDWRKRFNIIVGIARGILYIHQDSRLSIIHRDLKTSNILLDVEMNPKISDFGLARIFKEDQIEEKTKRIVGTFGYMSPEYVMFGKFSAKSDIFSFGVILLEIITGKKNKYCQEDCHLSMIGHVWHLWRESRALEIIDSSVKESYTPNEVIRCIQIGLLCVQEDALDRPTISTVVLMLNSETILPPPKQPAFILKKICNSSNSSAKEDRSCSVDKKTITKVVCR